MALTDREREIVKARLRSLREKNGVRTLDPVSPARSYEVAYYREIVKPINGLSELVRNKLLPALERYEARYAVENGRFLFADLQVEKIISKQIFEFERYASSFNNFAVDTATRFTRRNDDYHYRKFVSGINKQFGINIADQMSEDGVSKILRDTTKDNVDLIVDLPKKYYKQINEIVFNGLTSGDDFGSLRDQLVKIEGINKRRAKLIAVDQTGKLIGKLNQTRQENEGITRYQWDANLDDRTRERHVENDGKVFEWSDPTPGKAYGPPGEEVRCRCTGRGVVDEGVLGKYRPTEKEKSRAEKDRIIRSRTTLPDLETIKRRRGKRSATVSKPSLPKTQISKAKDLPTALRETELEIVENNYETGVVLDDAGNVIIRKKGTSNSVSFNHFEVEKMEGLTSTHNHPRGSNFSPDDWNFFAKTKVKEERAVGKKYTYSLTGPTPKNNTPYQKWSTLGNAARRTRRKAEKKYNQWFSDQLASGVEWKDVKNRNTRFEEILFEEHQILAKRYGLEYKRILTNATK